MIHSLRSLRQRITLLRRDTSGVALLEFAFSAPIVLSIGLYGVELSNLALAHLRISQVALIMADNMSRIGQSSALALKQVRESDINDAMTAANLQSDRFQVLQRGRIIVSSLERQSDGTQKINWQRCKGAKVVSSSYGANQDVIPAAGMGPTGRKVSAPAGTTGGVMFIEVQYDYLPVTLSWVIPTQTLKYTAAYTVRDQRDFTQVYNPSPQAPVASCSTYSAT